MSELWNALINLQKTFEEHFNNSGDEITDSALTHAKPGWSSRVWCSAQYRRAHIDVVDARQSNGLWMMHCCIFPHIHNPAPIYGFDIIAGHNKITGCFHDFSPAGNKNHPLIDWFANQSSLLSWKRERALPDWAHRIFTPNIIAAANVKDEVELAQIVNFASNSMLHYINQVGNTNHSVDDTSDDQNFYMINQKLNPHNERVMLKLGIDHASIRKFINECVFPEI
jgi:phycocyanobilin:ferredoxin oxidoreductase